MAKVSVVQVLLRARDKCPASEVPPPYWRCWARENGDRVALFIDFAARKLEYWVHPEAEANWSGSQLGTIAELVELRDMAEDEAALPCQD